MDHLQDLLPFVLFTTSSSMVASQLPCLSPKPRQPLRKRCQVDLTIVPISYRQWNKLYDCNCSFVLVFEDEVENKKDQRDREHQIPPPSPTPSLIEESHLEEIIEGLYIALVDDEADVPTLRTFDDEPFTHVVQVSYATPSWSDPFALSNWRREEAPRNALVQRLSLACPAIPLQLCVEQTAMSPKDLHAAREFLTLALPHGGTKWWPEELRKCGQGEQSGREERYTQKEQDDEDEDEDENTQYVFLAPYCELDDLLEEQCDRVEQDDDVNVLIVAPTSRAVDVLSVLFCYLVFLEDSMPEDVMEMDYCDEVWQEVVLGPSSMTYVDVIARSN